MKPNTPMLNIIVQIPVMEETDATQVLMMLHEKLEEAIEELRAIASTPDPEAIPEGDFAGSVVNETTETFTDATSVNLLEAMGYLPALEE